MRLCAILAELLLPDGWLFAAVGPNQPANFCTRRRRSPFNEHKNARGSLLSVDFNTISSIFGKDCFNSVLILRRSLALKQWQTTTTEQFNCEASLITSSGVAAESVWYPASCRTFDRSSRKLGSGLAFKMTTGERSRPWISGLVTYPPAAFESCRKWQRRSLLWLAQQ